MSNCRRDELAAGFAPEKCVVSIKRGMAATRARIDDAHARPQSRGDRQREAAAFRAGRTIDADDRRRRWRERRDHPRRERHALCVAMGCKRVYYSAFSPTGHPSATLPHVATPLCANIGSIRPTGCCASTVSALPRLAGGDADGMLDLAIDPKLAWALKHRERFPGRCQHAPPRELLLRVPGFGTRAVDRIVASRRSGALRLADIARVAGRACARAAVHHHRGLSSGRHARRRAAARKLRAARRTQLSLFVSHVCRRHLPAMPTKPISRRSRGVPGAADVPPRRPHLRRATSPLLPPLPDCTPRRTPFTVPRAYAGSAARRDLPSRRGSLRAAVRCAVADRARRARSARRAPAIRRSRGSRLRQMCVATSTRCTRSCAFAAHRRSTASRLHRVVRAGAFHPEARDAVLRRSLRQHGLDDRHADRHRAVAGRRAEPTARPRRSRRPTGEACSTISGAPTTAPPSIRRARAAAMHDGEMPSTTGATCRRPR